MLKKLQFNISFLYELGIPTPCGWGTSTVGSSNTQSGNNSTQSGAGNIQSGYSNTQSGMTRKVDDIIKSLEKIYRANTGHPEIRHLPKTSEQRANYWTTSGNLPLGLALDRIRERQSRGIDARIKYIDYDNLVDYPVEVMKEVFVHLELESFKIDPNNVKKSVKEDDSYYGVKK